jgi:hypothetical protein
LRLLLYFGRYRVNVHRNANSGILEFCNERNKTKCSYRILSVANLVVGSTFIGNVNLLGQKSESDRFSLKKSKRKLNLWIYKWRFSIIIAVISWTWVITHGSFIVFWLAYVLVNHWAAIILSVFDVSFWLRKIGLRRSVKRSLESAMIFFNFDVFKKCKIEAGWRDIWTYDVANLRELDEAQDLNLSALKCWVRRRYSFAGQFRFCELFWTTLRLWG